MLSLPKTPATGYSPLYFLAALGAGGLTVTFFMYLMFWVPHPGQPVPVFEDLMRALSSGTPAMQATVITAMAGIALMAAIHLRLLVWNLRQLGPFQRSEAWAAIRQSNAETQIMAVPLTLAMAVNVGFILGLVFVPGLWGIVEYLFPAAMAAFLLIGIYALRLMGRFLRRIMTWGGFDMKANNSFAQMMPAFAFSMVAVGLAAPVAMSVTPLIAGTATVLSLFFITIATIGTIIAMFLGMSSIVQNGTAKEAAPTLMVVIPILTVIGIAWMRLSHGLHVHFGTHGSAGDTLVFLARIVALQLAVGMVGLTVLRAQAYAADYLSGDKHSPGAYALICPGVGLSVMLHFFINKGLVGAAIIAKFGAAYWILTAAPILLQVAMIYLMLKLNARLPRPAPPAAMVPAE